MKFDIKAALEKIKTKRVSYPVPSVVILPDNSGQITIQQMHYFLNVIEKETVQNKG